MAQELLPLHHNGEPMTGQGIKPRDSDATGSPSDGTTCPSAKDQAGHGVHEARTERSVSALALETMPTQKAGVRAVPGLRDSNASTSLITLPTGLSRCAATRVSRAIAAMTMDRRMATRECDGRVCMWIYH
jgi:hypothetical protein